MNEKERDRRVIFADIKNNIKDRIKEISYELL